PEGLRRRAAAAGVNLVATYGLSETCGGCVYDGVPLDGVRVELDGERIGLGGPMAFLGYRGRPELTRAVLEGDLVRTSDRGVWSQGRLRVLGRADDIVISGGENVDLAAAQRVCDAEFGAGSLVLLAVPDPRWGVRVVGLTTAGLEPADVRARLEPQLGRASVPKELRRVDHLAYTSIGKIDRAALMLSWQEAGDHGDSG
ncbi:MAG: AMP-dependent synthetase, partial [Propionicimonas sp.]